MKLQLHDPDWTVTSPLSHTTTTVPVESDAQVASTVVPWLNATYDASALVAIKSPSVQCTQYTFTSCMQLKLSDFEEFDILHGMKLSFDDVVQILPLLGNFI